MKIGMRKPSIKRSISARTTGKLKRTVNKAVNPLYGQKGMGYINNPKKAVYNKVYNKTTIGVNDVLHSTSHKSSTTKATYDYHTTQQPVKGNEKPIDISKYRYSANMYNGTGKFLVIVAWVLGIAGIFTIPVGLLFIIIAALLGSAGSTYKKVAKLKREQDFNFSTIVPSYHEPVQSIKQQSQPISQQEPQKKTTSNVPPITFDTILVYNGAPQMQFEIKQTNVGDALEFEQDEEDRYLVSTQASYDVGYIHKRTADKIDALVNDGYEITGGYISEIIQADDKLNVKVHIVLEHQQ